MKGNRVLLAMLAAILVVCVVAGGALLLRKPKGTQVVVILDGEQYASYDLHTDQTVVISPGDGSWHNTLKIENGKAAVVESDCDNQICVHTPPLCEDYVGTIVCLPHKLVLELQ